MPATVVGGTVTNQFGTWKLERPIQRTTNYPVDDKLVALMAELQSFSKVATSLGVRRESMRDYLSRRPELDARMREHLRPRLTPEQKVENGRRSSRDSARRWRRANPDEARRVRREHMRAYSPEYRRRWNHYNRIRRLGMCTPDAEAREYVAILEGDPCSYCGGPMEHLDHIDPVVLGGAATADNLTAACGHCNQSKNAKPLLMFLLSREGVMP